MIYTRRFCQRIRYWNEADHAILDRRPPLIHRRKPASGTACLPPVKNVVTASQLTPLPARTFDQSQSTDTAEALLGEESNHKLSDVTSFKQKLTLYPNLTDSGKCRAQFDAGLVTDITGDINLQLTLSNRDNSDVPAGVKKNDMLFLTGINIAFGVA